MCGCQCPVLGAPSRSVRVSGGFTVVVLLGVIRFHVTDYSWALRILGILLLERDKRFDIPLQLGLYGRKYES
jgi:hypothetical protein